MWVRGGNDGYLLEDSSFAPVVAVGDATLKVQQRTGLFIPVRER